MDPKNGLAMIDEKDPLVDLFGSREEHHSWLKKFHALNEARHSHPYVADLIRVLLPFSNGLRRSMVMHELKKRRKKDGLPIPPSFEESVQSSYNQHSVDSSVFRKRKAPDSEGLFYSPDGKGSGRWAVNRERAGAWLRARLDDPGLFGWA
jgi:hypothetical protein